MDETKETPPRIITKEDKKLSGFDPIWSQTFGWVVTNAGYLPESNNMFNSLPCALDTAPTCVVPGEGDNPCVHNLWNSKNSNRLPFRGVKVNSVCFFKSWIFLRWASLSSLNSQTWEYNLLKPWPVVAFKVKVVPLINTPKHVSF